MDASPRGGALGEKEGGALSPKSAEGGVDREDSILTGRWAAPVGREGGSGWGTLGRGTPAFRVTLRVGGAL